MRALSLVFVVALLGCGSSDASGSSPGAGGSATANGGAGGTDAGGSGGAGGDVTAGAGGAPCDGSMYCQDDTHVASCALTNDMPQTSLFVCSVGHCKGGVCGACTTASDCEGGAVNCACVDGTTQSLPISNAQCGAGACEFDADCDAACAKNGGSKPQL